MLSVLRGASPPRTQSANQNPVTYENGKSEVQFHPPSLRSQHFMMTNRIAPKDPKHGPSVLEPPLHYHINQSERFRVLSGVGHFFQGLSEEPFVVLGGDGDGEHPPKTTARIEAKRYHRFSNASNTEDLVVEVQLDPEDYENEVRFFRNLFGYLNDCRRAGVAPSVFQLTVFLNSADTPLAMPLPLGPLSETVGVWVSLAFTRLIAFTGKWVLGYKDNYPEYYETGKSR